VKTQALGLKDKNDECYHDDEMLQNMMTVKKFYLISQNDKNLMI